MGKPVVHWEIWSAEHKKLSEFYQKLFDWQIDFNAFPNCGLTCTGEGGIGGGFMQPQPGPIPKNQVTFYVKVEDLQAVLDKAKGLGAEVVLPPTPVPGVGAMALFKDPDGNVMGLWSQ